MSNLYERAKHLKIDVMGHWLETEWLPAHPDQDLMTLWIPEDCVSEEAMLKFDRNLVMEGGYRFAGYERYSSPATVQINTYAYGTTGELTQRSGTFLYHFLAENGDLLKIMVVASFVSDASGYENITSLAAVPKAFMPTWIAFGRECRRICGSLETTDKVVIIGGRSDSFVPTVEWEDVILPEALKAELFTDVQSFFTKGIEVYKRLKLKPFRKLLLAGVPGTGKTMLCSALAKWAISQNYLAIYVSSANRGGAHFGKIQEALAIASRSHLPTLILLEEIDAYLKEEHKALVLNVLDGSESSINDRGTLLIATTNYPEAIDERVLKRPGRLDRIFIIPETRTVESAERMLRQYLGEMWQEDHLEVAEQLVGYPGAFIREVAIYALTQVAYDDLPSLPAEVLERSFQRLREQIEARDDFLKNRGEIGFRSKSKARP